MSEPYNTFVASTIDGRQLGFTVSNDEDQRCYVGKNDVPALIAWLRKTYPQHFNDAEQVLREVRTALNTPEGANVVDHANTVYGHAVAWRGTPARAAKPTPKHNPCVCFEFGQQVRPHGRQCYGVPTRSEAEAIAEALERAAQAMQRIRGER